MESEVLLAVLLRLLPSLAVAGLAFVAAADRKTRERWGNLLYQVGSIRPEQREDAKIGRSVKWPFFVVAVGLLLWPLQYYMHASRTIDATNTDLKQGTPASDLKKQADAATPVGTPVPTPTPGPAVHQLDAPSGTSTAPSTPAQGSPTGDLRRAAPATAPQPGGSVGDLKPAPR
jgi:hypothetical protein